MLCSLIAACCSQAKSTFRVGHRCRAACCARSCSSRAQTDGASFGTLGYFPSLGCPPPSKKITSPLASPRPEGERFGLVPPLLAALPALSARNPAVRSSREAGSRYSTQSPCQKTETRRIRTVRSRAISASGRRSVRSKRFKLIGQVTARGPPPNLGGLSRLYPTPDNAQAILSTSEHSESVWQPQLQPLLRNPLPAALVVTT